MYIFKVDGSGKRTTTDVVAEATDTIRDVFEKASDQGVTFNPEGLLQINGVTIGNNRIDEALSNFAEYLSQGRVNMVSSIVKQTGN